MHVLIIDDHPEFRTLLRHHISSEWPKAMIDELDPHLNAAALEDLDASLYDIVLLDHQLGQHDGMKLLQTFKQTPGFPPVIFLTAFGDERLAVAAIKNGADDYLPKSQISNALLVTTMRESLRGTLVQPRKPNNLTQGREVGESAVGIHIKGYDVLEKIASGTGSAVYLARSHARDEEVVLKLLYGSFELSDEHEVLERFLIEYQSISAIKHPNIVEIYDVGVADDHAFIAMEYIRGGSLRTKLRRYGALSPNEALKIVINVAEALDAIHKVGILHRDLKPGNVMFRNNGDLCIIDFGLAKQVQIEQDITQPGKIYGTPYYMSPEQGQGLDIDIRSDFYSLGVVLFELLTGRKPYVAGTPVALIFKHTYAPIPQLPDKFKDYQHLLDTLMAKNVDDRPASINEMLRLLKHCQTL